VIGPLCGPGLNDTVRGPVAFGAGPGTARTFTGALGRAPTTNVLDGADAGPVPIAFVPETRQVYVLPFVRAFTVSGEAEPEAFPAAPPLLDVHVAAYEVMLLPCGGAGPNATDAAPVAGVTLVMTGGPGRAAATTGADGGEAGLVPVPFVALTVQV